LGCQTSTLTPLHILPPPPPPGGYPEMAKWLFTPLTNQAGTGYTRPFFLIKLHGTASPIALSENICIVTKLHILVCIASLQNNCHFRNEANYNLLAVRFDLY